SAFLSRLGLPVFARISHDKPRLKEALRESLQVSIFVFAPIMIGLALAARPLVTLIYGARWEAAAPIVTLLALSGLLWPIHVLNLSALGAQGHSGRIFQLEILKTLILVTATLSLARFGPMGVAAGVLFSGLFSVAVNTWFSHKLLNYGLLAQVRDQGSTVMLLIAAAVPAWACIKFGHGSALQLF